ncbi:phosphotransferase [Catellatospora tritici]|uniref:phosphotransferase n=1 Tax=Catellatospora tritici TaxID=2851566 RepID=UPI001C2D4E81|nr:phosphotransferase [Catellatospora tritici]MBV1850812.1 phosphotransferase [Catellatospora tritici]MBV1851065.1 phosphotransferase [Catellatospora tritici]
MTGPRPTEHRLGGGNIADVVRIGQRVHRTAPERGAYVHELLTHLHQAGYGGSPRWHGHDEHGREILDYIDGDVPWRSEQHAALRTPDSLTALARLVRRLHDLTAGTALAAGGEVVCHHDLSPKNTVYRDGAPVAFLDWDLAGPGRRVQDLAHVCWQWLDLGPDVTDVDTTARLLAVLVDAYGLPDRRSLLPTVLWWQDRCRRGILDAAQRGVPAMVRLRESGVPQRIGAAHDWTAAHADALTAYL